MVAVSKGMRVHPQNQASGHPHGLELLFGDVRCAGNTGKLVKQMSTTATQN